MTLAGKQMQSSRSRPREWSSKRGKYMVSEASSMIKKLAMFLLLLTAPAFSQGVGGGGVPGAPVAALPTATAAGQVPTSTGAGTTYTAQTPASPLLANLPGTPNVVYAFTAPGDSCTATTGAIKDLSGNGNNATMGATPPTCTAVGLDFSNSTNSVVALPASLRAPENEPFAGRLVTSFLARGRG